MKSHRKKSAPKASANASGQNLKSGSGGETKIHQMQITARGAGCKSRKRQSIIVPILPSLGSSIRRPRTFAGLPGESDGLSEWRIHPNPFSAIHVRLTGPKGTLPIYIPVALIGEHVGNTDAPGTGQQVPIVRHAGWGFVSVEALSELGYTYDWTIVAEGDID